MSGEQRHRHVVAAGLACDPTLSAAQVQAAIAAVAGHPAALRSLAVAVTAGPAAQPAPGGPETQQATGHATPLTSQAKAITRSEE